MELRQLSYFVCLYREGTMTRAAQRLNIVQPALSAQIAKLEAEFGHKLFERSSRGMVPTLAGERAYEQFAPLLDRFAKASRAVKDHHPRTGQLRVGVISSSVNRALVDAIDHVAESFPDTKLLVIPGFSANLIARLREGVFDTVIINQAFRHEGLVSRGLINETLNLVGGKKTPEPPVVPVPLSALADLPLVLPSKDHGLRRSIHHVLQSHAVPAYPMMEVDDLHVILALLAQRPWYSILPSSVLLEDPRSDAIARYPLLSPGINRRIVAVRDSLRPTSPAEEAFVEVLEKSLLRRAEDAQTASQAAVNGTAV